MTRCALQVSRQAEESLQCAGHPRFVEKINERDYRRLEHNGAFYLGGSTAGQKEFRHPSRSPLQSEHSQSVHKFLSFDKAPIYRSLRNLRNVFGRLHPEYFRHLGFSSEIHLPSD